jgi:hypothetical protein
MLFMVQTIRHYPYALYSGILLDVWSFMSAYRVCLPIDGSARAYALPAALVPRQSSLST